VRMRAGRRRLAQLVRPQQVHDRVGDPGLRPQLRDHQLPRQLQNAPIVARALPERRIRADRQGSASVADLVQHSRRQLAVAGRRAVRRFFGHDVASPRLFSSQGGKTSPADTCACRKYPQRQCSSRRVTGCAVGSRVPGAARSARWARSTAGRWPLPVARGRGVARDQAAWGTRVAVPEPRSSPRRRAGSRRQPLRVEPRHGRPPVVQDVVGHVRGRLRHHGVVVQRVAGLRVEVLLEPPGSGAERIRHVVPPAGTRGLQPLRVAGSPERGGHGVAYRRPASPSGSAVPLNEITRFGCVGPNTEQK
jgi:hypothetical protein